MDPRTGPNPFHGLRPFLQEEADLFFGRDRQSDELVQRLASRRFLAVVGTSGSGKSSLVRAGLLPSLEGGLMADAGANWRMAILRPQDDPIGFLARAIVATGALTHLDLSAPAAEGVVETTLRRSSLGLVEAARLARLQPHENLLVLVDQFEELFRFADLASQRGAGDEAPAFVKLLLEAAHQTAVPIYVVITMRSDFLGDCARFRDLPEAISDGQYLIPRLTRDELQAVITGPIGVRGGRIATSLLQRLLNDVGDDMDQLPLLHHALMRAWDHWQAHDPEDRGMDLRDLDAIGGMTAALSRHADEAFAAQPSDRERTIAERLFKSLTERGADNREIRRPTTLARIAAIASVDEDEVIAVIDRFRTPDRSFLMPPHDVTLRGDSVIDISHESLIRQWRRLRTWVDEEAESRATYLRLVEAARLRREGKAGLWGEPDLTYARQWQAREAPNAAWAERYAAGFDEATAFLHDSENAHAAEVERENRRAEGERQAQQQALQQAEALAQAHRQRADEQATASARQRRLSVALAALLALVAAAAFYGWQQRAAAVGQEAIAQERSRIALSRQLAAQAMNDVAGALASADRSDYARGLLLAAQALHTKSTVEARSALLKTVLLSPHRLQYLWGRAAPIAHLAVSPDGTRVAAAAADGPVTLWDGATHQPLEGSLGPLEGKVTSVAFSPRGDRLAIGYDDATVRLWNVTTRQPSGAALAGLTEAVRSLAFSPDGTRLAAGAGAESGELVVWDVASERPVGGAKASDGAGQRIPGIDGIAFSPDGSTILSAGSRGTMIIWDAATIAPRKTLEGQQFTAVAFSPDGKQALTGGQSGVGTRRIVEHPYGLILWDLETGEARGLASPSEIEDVRSVAFGPGDLVAAGGDDGRLWLVSLEMRNSIQALVGHKESVTSLAFGPEGRTLISGSRDGVLIVRDLRGDAPLERAVNDPSSQQAARSPVYRVDALALTADGNTFAWDNGAGSIALWDVPTGTLRRELAGPGAPVTSLAFTPDGKTLAAASAKGVRLWEVATGGSLGSPSEYPQEVDPLAFSPDSTTMAVRMPDHSVALWDIARRAPSGMPRRGHAAMVTGLAFSPAGDTLASGSADGVVFLWDRTSDRPRRAPLSGNRGEVTRLNFSPDGTLLALVASRDDQSTATLWDLSRWQRHDLPTPPETLGLLMFSPDSRFLAASTDRPGDILLWDVAQPGAASGRLTGPSVAFAFSPEGDSLISVGGSSAVLWALSTRLAIGRVSDERRVRAAAFSRDARVMVSSPEWGAALMVRDWNPASWATYACKVANRTLTKAEWVQFVGSDAAYDPACAPLNPPPGR